MTTQSPRRVVILGSTGSIGVQTLDVIRHLSPHLGIVGLAAQHNVDLIEAQAREFSPDSVALADPSAAGELKTRLSDTTIEVLSGTEGLEEVATLPSADVVVGAMLGSAGLGPTLAAIRAGKTVALANKETLVAAGQVVTREASSQGVDLLPVDSEHSALYQCLLGEDPAAIRKLILTASGGPFVDLSEADLRNVTRDQALAHPTWKMGAKITIDSATLMNKGLEVIEAHWLFKTPVERIGVVVHRQSIVHSLVEFVDGSVKAQLGIPDMRLPIQYALLYPARRAGPAPDLDLTTVGRLTFESPDLQRFPCLRLAREAAAAGGTAPAVLNAANEVAVAAFLDGKVGFLGIARLIEGTLASHRVLSCDSLQTVMEADAWARETATRLLA